MANQQPAGQDPAELIAELKRRWQQLAGGFQRRRRPASPPPGQTSGSPRPARPGSKRRLLLRIPVILVVLLVGWLLWTSWYTVNEYEQAVVTTFGRYTATVSAGLHFKLPWPLQDAVMVPANRTHKLELGYRQLADDSYVSVPEESLMITGDMNVVSIDFFVEWRLSDRISYLYASSNPEAVLKNMLQSSVRSVVGTRSIDDTLTTGKIGIQADVQTLLNDKLSANDIGIQIIDVKVNDSEPPTEEVARAFRDVETAKQEKDTAINQANQYQNRVLPQARGDADAIVRRAEAAKQSRLNEASGEHDRFVAIYSEYRNYPLITRQRMYLEAIEDILPGVRVIIDDGSGITKLLPLDSFSQPETLQPESTVPSWTTEPAPTPTPTPVPAPTPEPEVWEEEDAG